MNEPTPKTYIEQCENRINWLAMRRFQLVIEIRGIEEQLQMEANLLDDLQAREEHESKARVREAAKKLAASSRY